MIAFVLSVVAAALIVPYVVKREKSDRVHKLALIGGAAYGVFGRFIFGVADHHWADVVPAWISSAFAVMSVSFLFLIPFAIGFLQQVARDPDARRRRSAWDAFFAPMVPVLLMLGIMSLLAIEGSICIMMALPALLLLAGIGGLVGHVLRRTAEKRARNATMALVMLLPYVASPVEQHLPVPEEVRVVENVVVVHAAPDVVWREIKSVRAIDPRELPFRVAHLIGLPRPIAATLSHDGVGGVRTATFERGLRFREQVTQWEPGKTLSFSIEAEPAPPDALDEHVAVGGRYFDVVDGTYRLEALPDGTTRLRLTSHQRLSTHFNFYAAPWSDFIMSDLQSAIMDVIRKRCEA